MGQAALRTPDQRFAGLPGWPWGPHYAQLLGADGPRLAYVDEGPRDAPVTALCLHGNPTWGYLYRHMVPVFLQAGLRVVVPDLIGFGRSDKPVDEAWHGFDIHRQSLLGFVEALDLQNVMLVCQDWGGIFGLTLPMAAPQRYSRLLVMNTTLGTGTVTDGFRQWRQYSSGVHDLAVGPLLRRGKPDMPADEAAAYDAPFPDASYKAALRIFAKLVPDVDTMGSDGPGMAVSRQAEAFWRQHWAGESFMAVGVKDPVLGLPTMLGLQQTIRACPPPMQMAEGGHFVQEWGAPIAEAALAHFKLARG